MRMPSLESILKSKILLLLTAFGFAFAWLPLIMYQNPEAADNLDSYFIWYPPILLWELMRTAIGVIIFYSFVILASVGIHGTTSLIIPDLVLAVAIQVFAIWQATFQWKSPLAVRALVLIGWLLILTLLIHSVPEIVKIDHSSYP